MGDGQIEGLDPFFLLATEGENPLEVNSGLPALASLQSFFLVVTLLQEFI